MHNKIFLVNNFTYAIKSSFVKSSKETYLNINSIPNTINNKKNIIDIYLISIKLRILLFLFYNIDCHEIDELNFTFIIFGIKYFYLYHLK